MESERVEMQKSLVNEISKGMGKLKQLKVSSSEQESALERMLSSYEEALFILTGRAPQGGQCRSVITSSSDPPASSPPLRLVSKYGGARAAFKFKKRQLPYSKTITVEASVENSEETVDDGYRWRKYGSKSVPNSKYQRSFFRCSDKLCVARKHEHRSDVDPTVFDVKYQGTHTCQAKTGVQSSLSEANSSVASSIRDLNA